MKIAVTGASGFIGKSLLEVLVNKGNTKIIALTRAGGSGMNCDLSDCCTGRDDCVAEIEWRTTDWSAESLEEALRGADSVIHLAGVRGTTPDPADYIINEDMTQNLLAAMSEAGAKRIVFASTISVYDDESLIPWKEDSPLKGRSAYGSSKINCEKIILNYSEKFGIKYAIARIAQVLGEEEKRRGMMNVFMDTARNHGTLKVMGKSEAKRQYIYVRDLAEILADLATTGEIFGAEDGVIVNAGMPSAYTNLEIAETVNSVLGNPSPIDYDDSTAETIRPSFMDISKLTGRLGYTPLDLRDALTAIRDWDRHRQ